MFLLELTKLKSFLASRLYSFSTSALHFNSFILLFFFFRFGKKIWDFASAKRKGSFPGGPDSYRGILYERDDENRAFAIRNDVYAAK